MRVGQADLRQCHGEQEIEEADAEKRNVTEAYHAPSQRTVAASPVFTMEEEAYGGAGQGSEQHSDPADEQMQVDDVDGIAACFRLNVKRFSGQSIPVIPRLATMVAPAKLLISGVQWRAEDGEFHSETDTSRIIQSGCRYRGDLAGLVDGHGRAR